LNLPSRSHFYFWGLPMHLGAVEQCLGRVLRKRTHDKTCEPLLPGYPAPWLNRSKAVFFMGDIREAEDRHSRMLLHLCGYLASFQDVNLVGEMLRVRDTLRANIQATTDADPHGDVVWPPDLPSPELMQHIRELDMEVQSLVRRYETPFSKAQSLIDRVNGVIEMAKLLEEEPPSKEDIQRALLLTKATGESGAAVRERLLAIAQEYVGCPKNIAEILDAVYVEFCDRTAGADRNLLTLPAEVQRSISDKMRAIILENLRPKTVEEMLVGVRHYYESYGRWPHLRETDPDNSLVCFRHYDRRIKAGRGCDARPVGLVGAILEHFVKESWFMSIRRMVMNVLTHSDPSFFQQYTGSQRTLVARYSPKIAAAFYYPHAWKAVLAFQEDPTTFEFVPRLTPEEANQLGMLGRREAQRILGAEGLPALLTKLRVSEVCDAA